MRYKSILILVMMLYLINSIVFAQSNVGDEPQDVGENFFRGMHTTARQDGVNMLASSEWKPTNSSQRQTQGIAPGSTVNSGVQALQYQTSSMQNPYQVQSITVRYQQMQDLTMEELAEVYAGTGGMSEQDWLKAMKAQEDSNGNAVSQVFKTPGLGNYVDVKFNLNPSTGMYEAVWPAGMEQGVWKSGEVVYKDADGNEIVLQIKNGVATVVMGWIKNNGNPNNGNTVDNTGSSYAYESHSSTYYSSDDLTANGKIYNDDYDIDDAIPTSENLSFEATADEASYFIEVRTRTAVAGMNDVTIYTQVEWPNKTCDDWRHENGCPNSYDYVYSSSSCEECTPYQLHGSGEYPNREYCITTTELKAHNKKYSTSASRIVYDVPRSEINPVVSANFMGAPVDEDPVVVSLNGSTGPGPITLTYNSSEPYTYIVQTHTLTDDIIDCSHDVDYYHNIAYDDAKTVLYTRCSTKVSSAYEGDDGYMTGVEAYEYGSGNVGNGKLHVDVASHQGPGADGIEVGDVTNTTIKEITTSKLNGLYETSGVVIYSNGDTIEFNPSDVFVHTPVVNNATITTSKFVEQKIGDITGTPLMLDEEFTITIPISGVHINKKGYSEDGDEEDYNKGQGIRKRSWAKEIAVKIPFDTYLHTGENLSDRKFIPAGTWIKDTNMESDTDSVFKFTIPVWVKEITYDIETRVIAENAPANILDEKNKLRSEFIQENANTDSTKYAAVKNIPVEVIGKIYDLRISASNDPAWANISCNGKNYVTAEEFPFGQQNQNKVTAYKFAPKLGYTFVFDFKTKGIKSNNVEVNVNISDKADEKKYGFYFVSKDENATEAKKVDLYYHTTANKYVKIDDGNTKDNAKLVVNLKNSFMKVATQELVDSVKIMKNKYNYTQNVTVGTGFSKMILPENLRLCYNNFAEYIGNGLYKTSETQISEDADNSDLATSENLTGRETVIRSVGHWYAGYRLPASTRAVPAGTNINNAIANNSFLTGGYILVKLDIKTRYKVNDNKIYDYLKYSGPEAKNEGGNFVGSWEDDDANQTIRLPNGNDITVPVGTFVIYDADLRSSNDVESSGTH